VPFSLPATHDERDWPGKAEVTFSVFSDILSPERAFFSWEAGSMLANTERKREMITMRNRVVHVANCALLVSTLCFAGCGYKVEVARYEEHKPSVTHHPNGRVSSSSGGTSFRLLVVEKQDRDQ